MRRSTTRVRHGAEPRGSVRAPREFETMTTATTDTREDLLALRRRAIIIIGSLP
jgi:hypothetical protein